MLFRKQVTGLVVAVRAQTAIKQALAGSPLPIGVIKLLKAFSGKVGMKRVCFRFY